MQLFNRDSDSPTGRVERKRFSLIPEIAANREVQWRVNETDERYYTSEEISQETVENLLALIAASIGD